MSKRLVTIVPHIENLELRKDTGQVPYTFYKLGYDSTLVSYYFTLSGGRKDGPVTIPPTNTEIINRDYPFLKSEVPGLKMSFLQNKGRGKFYEIAIYEYLMRESKNIDILNLFHFTSENIFYTLLYKLKNPAGKVYIKLDIDISFYESLKDFFNTGGKFGKIKGLLYKRVVLPLFFKVTTLFTAESQAGLHYFRQRFKISDKKIKLLPNGVSINKSKYTFSYEFKENIIVTVGRHGNPQKNTLFFLHALANLDLGDWKVILIGSIEKPFEEEITSFFEAHPEKKSQVIFTGHIQKSDELYNYYSKAKAFVSTSVWESFGIAIAESLYFGCYPLISNTIMPVKEFTNNGRIGATFSPSNKDELENILKIILTDQIDFEKEYQRIITYSHSLFNWEDLIKPLKKDLN